MSNSLYSLDPAVEEHLALKTFEVSIPPGAGAYADFFVQEKFDVKDFISSLSEKLIAQSKADAGRAWTARAGGNGCSSHLAAYDPKPFIRTFELAVDRLIAVRKELQKQTEAAETSVHSAERDYSKRMGDINGGFDTVTKSFTSMESKINEVGRTAIRVGASS